MAAMSTFQFYVLVLLGLCLIAIFGVSANIVSFRNDFRKVHNLDARERRERETPPQF